MSEILTVIEVALMFLIGLILIFDGYKVEKVIITILWFLLGFNIATKVLGLLDFSTGVIPFIIEVIVGLCFAAVGFKLEQLAFFVAVAYGVFFLVPSYFVINNKLIFLIVRLVIAIAVGLLAVGLRALIYILVASLIGATLMKRAILLLFPALSTSIINFINIVVVVLVIIGIISQLDEYKKVSD